ncbi:hypothetical protein ACNKHU_16490 [Shigella flexneri]
MFKSKEMLLINLHERDDFPGPYERMLFDTWATRFKPCTVTADVWRHHAGRAETGAMRRESVYHYQSDLPAPGSRERVAIAVDNALAYQEIHRLKERRG